MLHNDAAHPNPSLATKLQVLYALHGSKTIDLTIREPYLTLLHRLGDPHLHLPPVIHVAGTNGKGSTIAFMRAILKAAGYSVHVYTSPHLIRFNERIVLAGEEIADDALESLLDEATRLNAGGAVTFFEMTTAIAFTAFARTPADILLLETGLGGRLDCTNVVEHPIATVITPIGYDHMEFLGDTLESIATEKAGIMKPDAPCIVARQDHDIVLDAFETIARPRGITLLAHGRDWRMDHMPDGSGRVQWEGHSMPFPPPSLTGAHQIDNAATAIATLCALERFAPPAEAVSSGIANALWPGRLHRLYSYNGRKLPETTELWLDGAHNEAAAKALARVLQEWKADSKRPMVLVLGMLDKRPPHVLLSPLLPYADSLFPVAIPGTMECHSAATLEHEARLLSPDLEIKRAADLFSALEECLARQDACILVTGSLYLAASLL